MNDAGVGRLLVASLHQGIADLLPTRLEFYEAWLNPTGLREGKIGLAPLAAVLSFLRQEGEPYRLIAARAGEYSAEWLVASLPPLERRSSGPRRTDCGCGWSPGSRDEWCGAPTAAAGHSSAGDRDVRPWTSAARFSARSASGPTSRCASSTRRRSVA